jgi:hypothetical protein
MNSGSGERTVVLVEEVKASPTPLNTTRKLMTIRSPTIELQARYGKKKVIAAAPWIHWHFIHIDSLGLNAVDE